MVYRFDRFVLDPGARTLSADGEERHVEPKVFDVLLLLIEERHRVVSRDELFDRIWKRRFVSEWTLSSAVSGVRKALDDTGTGQRLIRTTRGHGFRFVGTLDEEDTAPPEAQPAEPSAPAEQEPPSIAVLPFVDVGGDGQEVFTLGLSEDIASALSRMRWLFVVSYASTRDFEAADQDDRAFAERLGVRYLLSGQVRWAGEALRITCRLVDAETGRLLWSERYDGALGNAFVLQDQITLRIATSLSSEVTLAEVERAQLAHPGDVGAWRAYLRALPLMHRLSATGNEEAKSHLALALERDPTFAPAHAALAWCAGFEAVHGWRRPGTAALAAAESHAAAALALSLEEPRAHCAMALVHFLNGRQAASVTATDRAIELDPNMPDAHGIRGNALAISGRPDAALEALDRALRGSPRDPMRWFWTQGMANACFARKDYDAATDWARQTVEIRPGWVFGHLIRAASAGCAGQTAEAELACAGLLEIVPDYTLERFLRGAMWTDEAALAGLIDGLKRAGIR